MVSASIAHNIGIAIGNILGGIAIQTVVLVILDGIGLGRKAGLTYKAASLQLVLEGVLVIAVLVICIMSTQLPQSLIYERLAPGDLLIVVTWLVGLWLVNKARTHLPWYKKGQAPNTTHPKQYPGQENTANLLCASLTQFIICECARLYNLNRKIYTPAIRRAIIQRIFVAPPCYIAALLFAHLNTAFAFILLILPTIIYIKPGYVDKFNRIEK